MQPGPSWWPGAWQCWGSGDLSAKSWISPGPAPGPAPAPPRLYTQLSLPTASNCGSMRRKSAEHCSSLMEVYREAVTRNLARSEDPQSRLYV